MPAMMLRASSDAIALFDGYLYVETDLPLDVFHKLASGCKALSAANEAAHFR
jgi:hypothetical protein